MVVVSEYTAPRDCVEVARKEKRVNMSANGKASNRIERLFVHQNFADEYRKRMGHVDVEDEKVKRTVYSVTDKCGGGEMIKHFDLFTESLPHNCLYCIYGNIVLSDYDEIVGDHLTCMAHSAEDVKKQEVRRRAQTEP